MHSIVQKRFYALAEVIISPLITSYVTRISDVNYSNTIYSLFILLTYILGAGFALLLQSGYQFYIAIGSLTLTILGILLFKEKIEKLTYQIK